MAELTGRASENKKPQGSFVQRFLAKPPSVAPSGLHNDRTPTQNRRQERKTRSRSPRRAALRPNESVVAEPTMEVSWATSLRRSRCQEASKVLEREASRQAAQRPAQKDTRGSLTPTTSTCCLHGIKGDVNRVFVLAAAAELWLLSPTARTAGRISMPAPALRRRRRVRSRPSCGSGRLAGRCGTARRWRPRRRLALRKGPARGR